jgi:hypothetical protein
LKLENSIPKLFAGSYMKQPCQGGKRALVTHVFDPNITHDWLSTIESADNKLLGHHVALSNATAHKL